MRRGIHSKTLRCLVIISMVAVTAPVLACSVPVFRYALERWPSDPYGVLVFHRGELSPEDAAIVLDLGPEGLAGKDKSNVIVRTIDLDKETDSEMLKFWKSQDTDTLPWMVVRYPVPLPDVWAGPLTAENVKGLLDSPVRREVARRILKGETAVWLLLESGNKTEDDAAYNVLQKRLKFAASNLKLPEIEETDIEAGLVTVEPTELKVAFSTLRVSRDDPQEQLLVEMLLGSEEDLRDLKKPMAFPAFGRGRILYALVGPGINNDTIDEACAELIGPCTCQVKDQNPGLDLLTSIDWEELIVPQVEIDKALPPLLGLGSLTAERGEESDSSQQMSANSAGASDTQAVAAGGRGALSTPAVELSGGLSAVLRNTLILVGLGVAGVFAVSLILVVRKN